MKIIVRSILTVLILQARSCLGTDDVEQKKDADEEISNDSIAEVDPAEENLHDASADPVEEPPDHINTSICGETDFVIPRAEAGDHLCVGKEDCYHTSGSPVGGCPNTCSCYCMYEVCYQGPCTLVPGCTEPPIYR
jgi:hypothetical protein